MLSTTCDDRNRLLTWLGEKVFWQFFCVYANYVHSLGQRCGNFVSFDWRDQNRMLAPPGGKNASRHAQSFEHGSRDATDNSIYRTLKQRCAAKSVKVT